MAARIIGGKKSQNTEAKRDAEQKSKHVLCGKTKEKGKKTNAETQTENKEGVFRFPTPAYYASFVALLYCLLLGEGWGDGVTL